MDKMLQESLAAEQREQEERRVQGVVDQYATIIKQRIKRYWIKPANSQDGLQCTLRVTLLPGGDVKQVNVIKSSGNPVFDRSAESAVYKAAPLPQPTDPKAAAALRDFQFIFKPE
jgi:colicin import membrane protein